MSPPTGRVRAIAIGGDVTTRDRATAIVTNWLSQLYWREFTEESLSGMAQELVEHLSPLIRDSENWD